MALGRPPLARAGRRTRRRLGYYLYNDVFWAKMGLLAAILARISFAQGIIVVLMVLAATAMARGYDVSLKG